MKWHYTTAHNRNNGFIEANSLLLAKIKLKEQNISFIKIKKVTWLFLLWFSLQKLYFANLNKQQTHLEFISSLALLLKSGVSILEALDILARDNHKQARLSNDIYHKLQAGQSITLAFSKIKVFNPLLINLLSISENTGSLYEILEYYVEYQEKLLAIKRKIKIALTYPMIVIVISTLILIFMFFMVIPSFQALFLNSNIMLPTITQFLFKLASLVRDYWLELVFGLLVISYLLRFIYNKYYSLRYLLAKIMLKTPILGKFIEQFNMTIFAHTFSLLYHSAIPIDISLNKIHLVIANPIYKKHLNQILSSIEQGETLYQSVVATKGFSNLVTASIHVGEETGELDSVLDKLGKSIEKTLNSRLAILIAFFEPMAIVIVLSGLGLVMIALYLPLFNLGNML